MPHVDKPVEWVQAVLQDISGFLALNGHPSEASEIQEIAQRLAENTDANPLYERTTS